MWLIVSFMYLSCIVSNFLVLVTHGLKLFKGFFRYFQEVDSSIDKE